jgi:glycosyltransferase involved in cell wall biosynthesis
MTDPTLTVIAIVGRQRGRAEACLRSLLAQNTAPSTEILLVDCAPDDAPRIALSDRPGVRVLRGGTSREFGELRADAVRQARAPLVAFIEEHCIAHPGWGEAIHAAHAEGWSGVGGVVHNGNPGCGMSDVILAMSFAPWMAPAERGPSLLLPGNNTSYRREVLLRFGAELPRLLLTEPLLQWRLAAQGERLLLEPRMRFSHTNETQLTTICRGFYLWNRCFGAARAGVLHWTWMQRAARVLSAPLVPCVRVARLMAFGVRRRRNLLGRFIWQLPAAFIAECFAVAGHTAGMLFGAGSAPVRFVDYEVGAYRTPGDLA